jgi:hypothetical protein
VGRPSPTENAHEFSIFACTLEDLTLVVPEDPTLGEIRIACLEGLSTTILPELLLQFMRQYPRVVLQVDNLTAPGTDMAGLRKRDYDLALVRLDVAGSLMAEDLSVQTARLEGASHAGILFGIVVPMLRGGLAAAALLVFLNAGTNICLQPSSGAIALLPYHPGWPCKFSRKRPRLVAALRMWPI